MSMTPEQKRALIDEVRSALKNRGIAKFLDTNRLLDVIERLADALEATPDTPDENARVVAYKIARLGAEHMPILAWGGGAAPEPMGEVCPTCGDEPCTFQAELDALLPALSRAAVPEEPDGKRVYAVCWRNDNGVLSPLEPSTVLRESAEADMERYRDAVVKGADNRPDRVVLGSKLISPWLPLPERGE